MNSQYKYRFKTEEEFIKEYGNDWRSKVGFSKKMDHILGTVLRMNVSEKDFSILSTVYWLKYKYFGWNISIMMVKEIAPNYKPKKFIKEI
jgi:hypothetical protein